MQKHQAVILSSELKGMASLDELMPEAALADFINEIHNLFETTLRFHHGKLKRFTGDTVLGVFYSGPTKSPSGFHALDAAFAIKEQLQALFSQKLPGQQIDLKMGIASGNITETVIGSGESQQTALLGEAVNNAERICRFCGNDQVLTDKHIFEAAGEYFEFQKLEPIPLKGGTESLPIFEPLNKKHKKLDLKIIPQRKIVSEMVGRSSEMEQLEGLIRSLVAGKGSIVNIVGKAGIGKTRLMAEMKVQPVIEKVQMLEGRALSTGQNLSYHPIINLIRSWAGITEDDTPAKASEKLQAGIQQIAPEQADDIYAFLATMMSLPLTGKHSERVKGIEGEALEKLILKNLRDLITAATKEKPRIYLVEDMHWSDASSIAMFESLYKLSLQHPVMFINVLRPGYKETGDYILKYQVDNFPGDHSTIMVPSLEDTDSGQLIENLLRQAHLPEDVQTMIIRKTEGNPFFIEEVIRSFIDEGIIEIHDNDFRVTEKIREVNIPETINEVILSRVDKLDEKTKELLKTASVIGRNFYFKVLEEAADTIGELDERLEYLKEVQLIGESKKKDEIEYLFKHALAQQATYESILLESKKELHLKIARSVEKVFADKIHEFYGVLAMHYDKAEMIEKKREYLIKAGDEAFRSGASNEAMNFYMEAIKLFPKEPQNETEKENLKDLEIKIGFAQQAAGNNIEAIETFQNVIQKYFGYNLVSNDLINKYRGLSAMLSVLIKLNFQSFFFRKQPDEEFNTYMKVVTQWGEALATMNPRRFFLQSSYFLNRLINYDLSRSVVGLSVFSECANLFMWTGLSFSLSKKILDYSKKSKAEDHPSSLIDYRYTRKMHDFFTGNIFEDPDFERVYQSGMRAGDFWPTTIYTLYSGLVCVELGKYEKLMEFVGKLEEISESFDNSHAHAEVYRLSVSAHYRIRKLDRALELSDEGIRYTGETGHFALLLVIWCTKSLAHSEKKELEAAIEALAEASRLVKNFKIITIYHLPYVQAKAQIELQELRAALVRNEKHREPARKLLKTINQLIELSKKMRSAATEAYRLKAIACWMLGKQKKAYQNFTLSIQAGQKYNGHLELSRAYFETGKFLADSSNTFSKLNGISADEYLDKAKTMFEEMDLQWDLEEYRKFVSGI